MNPSTINKNNTVMKKILLSILLLALPLLANADTVVIDGIYYNLIKKAKTAEVTENPNKYIGDVVIPDSIVFDGVTYGVKSIGSYAFFYCSDLKTVLIPNSITTIGRDAFKGCTYLSSVHINDISSWIKTSFYNDASNPLFYANHLYINGNKLEHLVIPDDVSVISAYSFCCCTDLSSVTINDNVKSIGRGAFYGCSSLSSIVLPNSITEISDYAFAYCDGLTSITIPPDVTVINEGLFFECSALTSIDIPNSVKSIGISSFTDCKSLVYVKIPNHVQYIENYSFEGCSNLSTVVLPSCLRGIGTHCFAYCQELSDIYCYVEEIPQVESDAFEGSYIEYVTLHVPAVLVDRFIDVEPWCRFGDIIPIDDGITTGASYISSKDVLIQNNGGIISISGLDAGTAVGVYYISGTMVGSATASTGVTTVSTSLSSGDIAIVKIGGKSIKVLLQ